MSLTKDFHLTQVGLNALKEELDQLKSRRLEVAQLLKAAKDQGDLSENSDWANAQDEFKFVDGRISDIEHIIRNATIIKNPKNKQSVQLGSTVHLESSGKTTEYTIVGSLESDPGANKISDESPIGKALIGKNVDDLVDIKTPAGVTKYRILKIT